MNVETGKVYDSLDDALKAGENPKDIVEVFGSRDAVDRLSANVYKAHERKRKQQRKQQKAARRKNREK